MNSIPLSGSDGKHAVVDDNSFDWLNRYAWRYLRIDTKEYACRTEKAEGKRRLIFMHRAIMDAQPGEIVDHADGDGLNNVHDNLRIATASQNAANRKVLPKHTTSRYRGVRSMDGSNRWIARIHAHGQNRHLGCFATEEEAALAYNVAALESFGEFAQLNHVPGVEPELEELAA